MIGYEHVRNTCPFSPQLLQNINSISHPVSKLLFRFRQMSSQSISFDPATVLVSWTGGSYSSTPPVLVYGGFGYSQGDVLTFQGTLFGAGTTPANDLTLSFTISATGVVSAVTASGTAPSGTGSITLTIDNVRGSKMNRDAGDHTKMLKQRLIHLEKRRNSPILSPGVTGYGNAELAWIPQGNQYRLDYLFGKMKCRACTGGAFNLNGPQSSS